MSSEWNDTPERDASGRPIQKKEQVFNKDPVLGINPVMDSPVYVPQHVTEEQSKRNSEGYAASIEERKLRKKEREDKLQDVITSIEEFGLGPYRGTFVTNPGTGMFTTTPQVDEKKKNIERIARIVTYTSLFELDKDQSKRFLKCLLALDINGGDMVVDFKRFKVEIPPLSDDGSFEKNEYYQEIYDTLAIDHPVLSELFGKVESLIIGENPSVFSELCIQEYLTKQGILESIKTPIKSIRGELSKMIIRREVKKIYLSLIPCEELVQIFEFYTNFITALPKMTFPHKLDNLPPSLYELYAKEREAMMKLFTLMSRNRVKQLINIYTHSIVDLIADFWGYYVRGRDSLEEVPTRFLVTKIHCYRGNSYSALVVLLCEFGVILRFVPLVDIKDVSSSDFEIYAKDIVHLKLKDNRDIGPNSDLFQTISKFLYLVCVGDTNMNLSEFYKTKSVSEFFQVKATTLLDDKKRNDFYSKLKQRYDPEPKVDGNWNEKQKNSYYVDRQRKSILEQSSDLSQKRDFNGREGITISLPSDVINIRFNEMMENNIFSLENTDVPMLNLNGTFSSSSYCVDFRKDENSTPYAAFKIKENDAAVIVDTIKEVFPTGFIINWKRELIEGKQELRKMIYKDTPLFLDYSNKTTFQVNFGVRLKTGGKYVKLIRHNVSDYSVYRDLHCILVLGVLEGTGQSTRYSFGMLNRIMRFDRNANTIYEKALQSFVENEDILAGIY